MDINQRIFLAATGNSLARAEYRNNHWIVTNPLKETWINRMVANSTNPQIVYAATQHKGILRSQDAGLTWTSIGMAHLPVKSIAIDPASPRTIYAGCKPVSLFVSYDGGGSWEELEAMRKRKQFWWFSPADPPGVTPYVSGLAVSPEDPDVLLAGIEVGALMRSEDGGRTWTKHLRGGQRDCHSLKFHPFSGQWAYEGGGGGVSFSQDGGRTWRKSKDGLGSKYGWMVAPDPGQPDLWYLSASEMPKLLRGEFDPPAHQDGKANAHIYRKAGDEPWVQLSGGLPEPLDDMAYDLATIPENPGYLFAGLANGDVWYTGDYGDVWEKLPFSLGGIHTSMIVI